MNSQFTIRLDDLTNKRTIQQAQVLGLTRAQLVRNALNSYLDNPNPKEDSEIVSVLKDELEKAHEAKSRSDLITLELTKSIRHQQELLEDINKPKSLWQKLRTVFN